MATRQAIHKIITLLSVLPNCPITKENAVGVNEMFFAALEDVPEDFLQAAYLQYISGDRPFFPSNPGTLRELAFDLELVANKVPTAAQAWAMALDGPKKLSARWCETGARLRDSLLTGSQENFGTNSRAYGMHVDKCGICNPHPRNGDYAHGAVTEAVLRMGGREAIFTENLAADRARFMDSYRELVIAERRKLQMVPVVRALVDSPSRPQLGVGEGVNLLTSRMAKG